MGVREAIEGLPTEPVARPQRQVGYAKVHDDYINRADVLSILDEHLGEYVTDYKFEATGLLRLVLKDEAIRLVTGLPGDHIAIYKRRSDGSIPSTR